MGSRISFLTQAHVCYIRSQLPFFFPFSFSPPSSSSLSLSLFCSVLLCLVLSCLVLFCFVLFLSVLGIRYSIFVQTDTTCTQFTRLQEGEEVWNYYGLWSGHVMGLPHLCSRDDSKWGGGGRGSSGRGKLCGLGVGGWVALWGGDNKQTDLDRQIDRRQTDRQTRQTDREERDRQTER